MCGIVGFIGKVPAAPILLDGLSKLEYRGYDSAGIAVIDGNSLNIKKTKGRIKDLSNITDDGKAVSGTLGIGHTRWATHGEPSDINSHPHSSQSGKIAVVHNGIIENYLSLKEELIEKGYTFVSQTDTEVVAHLVEYYYDGDLLEAVEKSISRLEGSYALGIVCTDEPDRFVAVRQASPLIVGVASDATYIASDVTPLITHTRDVIYLEDNELVLADRDGVTVYNRELQPITKDISKITWNVDSAEKGGYDHFMIKEIMEQPKVIADTIGPRIKDGRITLDDISLTKEDLEGINRILITACGSAYHVGMVAKYVLEELTRIPVEVDLASELRYRNPIIDKKTLTIVISQSGETADTKAAMEEAKRRGSRTLSIVNVVGSAIAKLSDDVLYTWAGPEISVATTKAYSAQLAVIYLFGIYAADLLGTKPKAELDEMIKELEALPEKIKGLLSCNDEMERLAKRFYQKEDIFFIGRNLDYAVALEGSLKLKEISYIHSEAYAAGELKHGTISLIDDGRLVVSVACCDALFDKLLSNTQEVKTRGAVVMAIATQGRDELKKEADEVFFIPKTHPLFTASLAVVPLQLFAYHIAKNRGCDIDKPRNLAKSVTVE